MGFGIKTQRTAYYMKGRERTILRHNQREIENKNEYEKLLLVYKNGEVYDD